MPDFDAKSTNVLSASKAVPSSRRSWIILIVSVFIVSVLSFLALRPSNSAFQELNRHEKLYVEALSLAAFPQPENYSDKVIVNGSTMKIEYKSVDLGSFWPWPNSNPPEESVITDITDHFDSRQFRELMSELIIKNRSFGLDGSLSALERGESLNISAFHYSDSAHLSVNYHIPYYDKDGKDKGGLKSYGYSISYDGSTIRTLPRY